MLQVDFSRPMLVVWALGMALVSSSAAPIGETAPQPTIELSTQTDSTGRTTVKIVLEGVPPEKLTPERLDALMGFLGKETEESDTREGRSSAPVRGRNRGDRSAAGGERELREFDMELNLHWKRAASPGAGPAAERRNRPGTCRVEEAAQLERNVDKPVDGKIGTMVDEAKAILKNLQGAARRRGNETHTEAGETAGERALFEGRFAFPMSR